MNINEIVGGMRVKVVATKDGLRDGTFDRNLNHRVGWVRAVVVDDCGAGCDDPMVIVRFPGGIEDGFWLEEIQSTK